MKKKVIEGPPDLIVEVLSPATARNDRKVKFDAYERAGVRESWIANPKTRSVEVYTLARNEYAPPALLRFALQSGASVHGEFGPGEEITSTILPDFAVLTDSLFTV